MFDDLRDAFREAVQNFKDELGRDEAPDTVDRLFLGMTREVAAARGLLAALERQIEEARAQASKDAEEEARSRRQGEMAQKVGDAETARIALEWAVKHERRRIVLEKKIVALDEERQIRVVELEEMTVQLTEARAKRDDLAGPRAKPGEAAGSGDASDAVRAADELFAELDRMTGESGGGASPGRASAWERNRAMDDLEREFRELRVDPWAPVPRKEIDPDAALEELKRRMRESESG